MANFLDDLSIYNAKAAAAISAAVVECNNEKANMMSSLKTTANDITLSEEIRLNALTALINLGNLLDIPLPPYFPVVTTYALTETFVGVHNDLDGIQGGAPGEYYHLTDAERTAILNKASVGDINWEQLAGVYSDNVIFGPQFDAKQDGLVAPAPGTYFVKINGTTVSYDINSYITTISGIAAGGELEGTYPNPNLSNAAVIGKVLTGWNGSVTGTITATDTILTALQKLNANINNVITNPSGVASVALTSNAPLVFTTTTTPQTGAASLSLGLNTQNANLLLASPNGTNGLPLFRALAVDDLPNSGVTVGTFGSSTVIPQIQVDAKGRITGVTPITAASGGQVNTVGLSVPGILSPSFVNAGTPSDPIITLALDVQTANYVWAGPETGADAVPFFRLLVEDDIPDLPLTKITGLPDVLANKLDNELNDGEIWIGNSTNAPQMRSLTQDILITNEGVVTIQPNVVTFSKMQEITGTNTSVIPNVKGNLLGRWAAGLGEIQEVVLSGDFNLNVGTGVLSLAVPVAPVLTTKGGLITYSASVGAQVQLAAVYEGRLLMTDSGEDKGIKWVEAQGDIEVNTTLLDGTFNIKTNAVTLGKIQQLPAFTVIGNATSTNPATATALSKAELTTLVNQFTIDTAGGNTALPGVVPGFNINGFPAGKSASDYFLNAAGGWTVPAGGGGGGSGTVTSVSVVTANGFAGTVANATTTPAITLTTSVTGLLKGDGAAISDATIGTGLSFSAGTLSNTGVTSVGLTMPSAFSVSAPNPITTSGTFTVTGAGTVAQYIRGDGSLATFPTSGGGGSGVNYYLNGSVIPSPAVAGYNQMSRVANTGAAANFTVNNTTGFALMAQFVTDANDPALLNIPAGSWDFNFYFSSSNNTANPQFYVDLLKYDGTTFTPIATGIASAETITNGTTIDLYTTAIAVPSTVLTLTDRLVIRVYVDTDGSGRTITFYTQDTRLAEVFTTFTTGLTALNGLTAQVQLFANGSSGTAPAFVSSTATHTLNIPLASAASVTAGLISKTDYDSFAAKMSNPMTAEGDIIYGGTVTGGVAAPQRLAAGADGLVLKIVSGLPSWQTGGGGDVSSNTSSTTQGNFAVFADASGKLIGQSSTASLTTAGRATFNSGVDVGVSGAGGTTGSIVFRASGTTAITTISAPGNPATSATYILPTAQGTATNVLTLQDAGTGQLAWTSAGSGNLTSAGTNQVVTGDIRFQSTGVANVGLVLRNNANTFATTFNMATSGTAALTYITTFPAATGTVALLQSGQSWTGAQTFGAATTFGADVSFASGAYQATLLSFAGTTSNRIQFAAGPVSAPLGGATPPVGTRITVANSRTVSLADFTIGMASSTEMYLGASGATGSEIAFYNLVNKLGAFTVNGLSLSRTEVVGSGIGQLLINAGASTSTGIGNATSYILFSTSVSAAPGVNNTRTTGTRIVLQPNVSAFSGDAAIGHNATENETWLTGLQTPTAEGKVSFYSAPAGSSTSRRTGYFAGYGLVFDTTGSQANGAGVGAISFTAANWINFGSVGTSVPSINNTRGAGTKIILRPNTSVNKGDYAIGVNSADYETWITGGASSPVPDQNGGMVGFWVGQFSNFKRTVWITEDALNLAVGTVIVGAGTSQNVFNTVATTVNFAGAATTVTIGATTGTATIRNATLALPNATQITVQSNKVVGVRRTGWTAPAATPNRAALPATPTLAELSQFCAALYQDLASAAGHGLIN